MNLGTAKTKIFMLIDSYSKSGTILDPNSTKQKDYTYKIPFFLDQAQKLVSAIKKIVRTKQISHNMPLNLLAESELQFDIVQHLSADQVYKVISATAYYFEVDDVATVYIKELVNGTWTTLLTITNTLDNAGKFTAFKGFITPTNATNEIAIVFSGTTGYNHRNRALFNFPFSDVSRIPDYKKYVLYTMPDDFYQLNKVILKGNTASNQQYTNTSDYFWEGSKTIALSYDTVAEYLIEYFAFPITIDATTLDIYEFEISKEAQEALPYYVASQLLLKEDLNAGDRLLAIYNNILANLDSKIINTPISIQNSLFQPSTNKLF